MMRKRMHGGINCKERIGGKDGLRVIEVMNEMERMN